MKELVLKGCFPAIVTPFNADGSQVDYASLERLIDFLLINSCAGVVACGSTGEAQTLSDEEYRQVVAFIHDRVKGRGLCIAGVGAIATNRAVQTVQWLEQQKIDAAMVVTPSYVKPTQLGLVAHFSEIAANSKLPIIAYNVPSRTGINLLPATVATLAERASIVGLKEASCSVDQIVELVSLGITEKISLLAGEDSLINATIASGGVGTISVVANLLPKQTSQLVELALNSQSKSAGQLQAQLYQTIKSCFAESNPIPVKAALKIAGLIEHDSVRLPLTRALDSTKSKLKELIGQWSKSA